MPDLTLITAADILHVTEDTTQALEDALGILEDAQGLRMPLAAALAIGKAISHLEEALYHSKGENDGTA
jgi:hypothetical protein